MKRCLGPGWFSGAPGKANPPGSRAAGLGLVGARPTLRSTGEAFFSSFVVRRREDCLWLGDREWTAFLPWCCLPDRFDALRWVLDHGTIRRASLKIIFRHFRSWLAVFGAKVFAASLQKPRNSGEGSGTATCLRIPGAYPPAVRHASDGRPARKFFDVSWGAILAVWLLVTGVTGGFIVQTVKARMEHQQLWRAGFDYGRWKVGAELHSHQPLDEPAIRSFGEVCCPPLPSGQQKDWVDGSVAAYKGLPAQGRAAPLSLLWTGRRTTTCPPRR